MLTVVCAVLFGIEGSGMMIGNTGAFLTSKLPYDAEVEYLESTGTQYIDIGVAFNKYADFHVQAETKMLNSNRAVIIGNYIGGSSPNIQEFGIEYGGTSNKYPYKPRLWMRYGAQSLDNNLMSYFWPSQITTNAIINLTYSHASNDVLFEVNGISRILQAPTTNPFAATTENLRMFSDRRADAGSVLNGMLRIYSLRIESETTVRNFQPIRFTNELGQSEGAMYDRANPTIGMDPDGSPRTDGLYRNRGTGAFVIGSDKTA